MINWKRQPRSVSKVSSYYVKKRARTHVCVEGGVEGSTKLSINHFSDHIPIFNSKIPL